MRGKGRRSAAARSHSREATDARETVERRWSHCCSEERQLAPLVTGDSMAGEPFHRWLPYKQGFAPELVRQFHREALQPRSTALPLLDPFAGSGTFVVECARNGVSAVGVEALASLVFVATATASSAAPELPDLSGRTSWQAIADRLDLPVHRAALICAVARLHTSKGRLNKNAPPLPEVLDDVLALIREDLRTPLAMPVSVVQGDARNLRTIEDGSIGGILTSPPYLSRHDYIAVTRPHEMVYRYWHEGRELTARRQDQVRAHPRAYSQQWSHHMPPSVSEACEALAAAEQKKLAGVVRSYFEDIFDALRECNRVLAKGAPCWIVIGGARLKEVYIPTDTILADFAQHCGFNVERIRIARRLIPGGRNFGSLQGVSPRESMIVLRKASTVDHVRVSEYIDMPNNKRGTGGKQRDKRSAGA